MRSYSYVGRTPSRLKPRFCTVVGGSWPQAMIFGMSIPPLELRLTVRSGFFLRLVTPGMGPPNVA